MYDKEVNYIIERFEDNLPVAGSARYVGTDWKEAVAILDSDIESGTGDYRLRTVYL